MKTSARTLALALCLLPLPVLADPPAAQGVPDIGGLLHDLPLPGLGPPMTAAEFEAYAVGKTLTYAADGKVWGQEKYLPGHQVVWAFANEPCEYGSWAEVMSADASPMLCFVYENNPDPNCWQFYNTAGGLVALFVGSDISPVSEVAQTSEPMQCPGPRVGV